MSAYLMGPEELAMIARALVRLSHSPVDPEVIFGDLLNENLASVGYRYPDAQKISDWFEDGEALFVWANLPEPEKAPPAQKIEDAVRSYQYQSCEHPGWSGSNAQIATTGLLGLLEPLVIAEKATESQKIAARQAAFQRLPSLYPKETAKALRKILKAQFPACVFQVVTERGSMVSSVRVSWVDGPTEARVREITDSFKSGQFNGMTDSFEYSKDHLLMIEGVQYRPACQYVFTNRTISPALASKCIAQLVTYWGGITNPPRALPGYGNEFLISDNRGHDPIREDLSHMDTWYSMVRRAAEDATKFTREGQ